MNKIDSSEKVPVSLESHPFYFAHYLNMARHNAYVILEYISGELSVPGNGPDENTLSTAVVLNDRRYNRKPDELSQRNRLLVQHFPFLRETGNGDAALHAALSAILKTALVALHQWRNNTSHYPPQYHHNKDFDLRPFFSFAIESCKKRMKGVFLPEDFQALEADENQHYALNNDAGFTEKGLCFFLCFFLEKKYAFQFLAGIKGFKNTSDNKFRATLEAFTEHCCRLPKPKLNSSDIKLDMLGELSRCPAPLFDLLDAGERRKFIREPEKAKPEEQEETQQVLLKRYDDRFPYFVLRYFEEKGLPEGISFHVHLGKWLKGEHQKEIMGAVRERRLLKDIRAFGELKKFSPEHIPDFWLKDGVVSDDVEQFSPRYQIVGNRIGIKLDYARHNRWPKPDRNGKIINVKPDAIISTYEFINLFLYNYLYQKGLIDQSAGEFIREYLDRFHDFLNEFKAGKIRPVGDFSLEKKRDQGNEPDLIARREKLQAELDRFGLKTKDLPDKIREYLLGYKQKNAKKQAKWILGGMKKEVAYWKNKAEQSPEKMRAGDMAQLLARDIIFMAPFYKVNNHPQKLNSLEYDVLQYALAYFPSNRDKLYSFFKEHQLTVKGDRAHPFLYKIRLNECRGILDFFHAYMQEKERWLQQREAEIKSPRFNEKVFFSNYSYLIKTDTKRAIDMDYASTPYYLPRGIFNKSIVEALQKGGVKITNEDNVSHALSIYCNGRTQSFYNKKRYYNKGIFRVEGLPEDIQPKDLAGQIQSAIKKEEEGTEEYRNLQKLKNRILNTEKEIRYIQNTDRVLWLLVTGLFPETFGLRPDDLEMIGHDLPENDLLSHPYPMQEAICNYTITDSLPIRRYGEFRRFLKDRRLENLLKYFAPGVPVQREILIAELETYDLQRKNLLEIIYRFEKLIFDRHKDELKVSGEEGNYYIKHRDYLDFVAQRYGLHEEVRELDSERFADLRNKMLHNQIPYKPWIKEAIDKRAEQTICGRIMGMIGGIYEQMAATVSYT